MSLRILAASSPGEVRIALTRDDDLLDYAIWRVGAPDGVGDIHRGRVVTRVPAMAGAFVALAGTEGFLPDSAGAAGLGDGDRVTVRVTRAAQSGKGPRLALIEAGTGGEVGLLERGPGVLLELAERHPEVAVYMDDAALAAKLKPKLAGRLALSTRVFDEAIEEQIASLAQPSVELPGGMRLHVHPTPALTAIDVDAGGSVAARQGKTALHMAANRAMLAPLARQIRLRNLSGAILVDFAGLPVRRRASLAPALSAALAEDPLHPRLLGFTALGLAEIVRSRIHPPLHEQLEGPHAAGLAALRTIAADVAATPHHRPALHASPAIVAALQADPLALSDLARRTGRALMLRSDPALQPTAWTIEAGDE